MTTKQDRIRAGNKVEHAVALQLEYRGFTTVHPAKAISADGMNDAKEYSDTFDFLYFKKQVKGAMVKSFKDLNVFSVSEEDPDPIPDLLNSNGMRQVCLDPVKKWKDKEDEEWWEQRSWFVCDKLLTFALVFPGKDRDSWLIQDHRFTNDYKAQPWYMAEVTEETKWIDLTQKLTHASPAVVDILELSNQLSSFRI